MSLFLASCLLLLRDSYFAAKDVWRINMSFMQLCSILWTHLPHFQALLDRTAPLKAVEPGAINLTMIRTVMFGIVCPPSNDGGLFRIGAIPHFQANVQRTAPLKAFQTGAINLAPIRPGTFIIVSATSNDGFFGPAVLVVVGAAANQAFLRPMR